MKKITKIISILLILAGLCSINVAKAMNFSQINTDVKSSANTGGNRVEGAGEIKTGSASASSSSTTTVKGGGETNVEVKAKAEANGKKAEVEASETNTKGNVSVHREVSENGAEAKVDVDVDADKAEESADLADEDRADVADYSEENNAENKNLFTTITEGISNTAKRFWEGMISLFS
jgi:hypothetical protein